MNLQIFDFSSFLWNSNIRKEKYWMKLELAYDMNWLRGRPQFCFLFLFLIIFFGKRISLVILHRSWTYFGLEKRKKGGELRELSDLIFNVSWNKMTRRLRNSGLWIALKDCLEKFIDIRSTKENFQLFRLRALSCERNK